VSDGVREQTGTRAAGAVGAILCVYCREPIAADAFAYWSSARRLLSAVCPACERRVTLPAATWRRLSILLDAGATAPETFAKRHP
jgi:hypothetical protein